MATAADANPNLVSETEHFVRTNIKIPSLTPKWNLDAWCYLPKAGRAPHPVIIMAHGLGSNKLMGLAVYAQAFASAGYACVVFDYRRWGASDGTPRNSLYIADQLDDYRTVIKYCRQQPEFDPQRVIIWGTSLAGGHVSVLSAEAELNLSAVVAQCPWLGIGAKPALSLPLLKLIAYSYLDWIEQAVGFGPLYVPTAAAPGQLAILNTPDSPMLRDDLPYVKSDFPNEITASAVFQMQKHRAVDNASKVTCPILIVHADHDSICVTQGALDFARNCPKAELVRLECGHFDIYPRQPYHKQALDAELEFIKRIVPV
ncbi:hypothetical protein NM688_g6222 [Phlebia brevispora]|uniref:Uncharacterized protein n=1 Tax=Phlebia brevispora TaxID=194682 RepID=A0ACC1SIN9_9APHY|nr:hypothetical protein NM688_g6222 [Phlebia brevispora]